MGVATRITGIFAQSNCLECRQMATYQATIDAFVLDSRTNEIRAAACTIEAIDRAIADLA
jgi:hypothetical protein